MFDAPDQIGQRIPARSCPIVLCPACGSPNLRGNYDEYRDRWSIDCPKCGTEMEIPSAGTDLESACELLNRSERLKYEVNKVKEEGKHICK